MKLLAFFVLFLILGTSCFSQNFQLKIIGNSALENKVLDSIPYKVIHDNAKTVNDEVNSVSERLSKIGYIENHVLENIKKNDSSYVAKLSLGEKVNSIHVYIGKNFLFPSFSHAKGAEAEKNAGNIKTLIGLDQKKDTIIVPYNEVESFLNQTLQKLEQKGFALAKLKLTSIQKKNNILYADLKLESDQQRKLNSIVVQFAESNKKNNFPKGHLKQINRKYRSIPFNQDVVRNIQNDFEKFRFVSQIKYPEILFTKDSTKVYVYLEKRKSNNFDGFVGFTNNKNNKLIFNGYLDLKLENALKAGEQLALNWKSDGNNQETFKASIDLPYLFQSPIGLKAQIYIFKQDSIFQNTKTAIDLGYFVNYNTRIYLGYQSTESSDIQNTNNSSISDYNNSFLTTNFEYTKLDSENPTSPKKTSLSFTMGLGKRTTNQLITTFGTYKQAFININAMHNFYLNKKNSININYQNYFLKSDNYIINELYRFGGINSIRGFSENSLQANFMTAIVSEYRYLISRELFVHSVLDYCYYQDDSIGFKGNLFGFGLGMGLQTKNGLLKLILANGITKNQEIKFSNTIVNLRYNIVF